MISNNNDTKSYSVIEETSIHGLWFTVVYKGRFIDGFRSYDDAVCFAEWYADSNKTTPNAGSSGMGSLDSKP